MNYEWDEKKREANLAKHGVDFIDILPLLEDAPLRLLDERQTYGETRSTASVRSKGDCSSSPTHGAAQTAELSAQGGQMRGRKEDITRVSVEQARRMKGKTDYARLDALTDKDIAKAVARDPDAAPLDIDWTKARMVISPGKEVVTLRVDQDVVDFFRRRGRGYQTRMNAVLRAYCAAHQGV